MDLGTMIVEITRTDDDTYHVDEQDLFRRADAFMDRVRVEAGLRDELRPLLVRQVEVLLIGVRAVHNLHEATGKFRTAQFKVRVVLIVHFE